MKDIGYYAGFLSTAAQKEITEASPIQLGDLLFEVSESVYNDMDFEGSYSTLDHLGWEDNTSTRDRLALIRGLCDRIELKLMEAAK